jgi:creatinine amidohydrolase
MTQWMHELRRPQVEAYLERDTVILLPMGSVEQHGRHLPLMTDAAQAIAVSEEVAKRAGVLIAPPVWCGWSPFHMFKPGSLTLRPETLANLTEDILNSLIHGGFERIIIISGHTTMNYIPIDPVALRVRQLTGAYVATVDVGLIAKREIAQVLRSAYDGHAGEWETSFMLHRFAEFVDMGEATRHVPLVNRGLSPTMLSGDPRIDGNSYQLYPTLKEYVVSSAPGDGITGDATLATAEQGAFIFEAMVENTLEVVAAARHHALSITKPSVPV